MFDSPSIPTTFPFEEADYHRTAFVPAPYGPMKLYDDSRGGAFNGVLVFKREHDVLSSDDLSVLEVFVAGDTAFNTWSLLTQHSTDRPMVHELLWKLLEQAQGRAEGSWSLLHVAIVGLKGNTFIGRLFFGDANTGEIKWDCDCRPSDGCYLSLKARCPFYVHKRVWDQTSLPIRSSAVYKMVAGSSQYPPSSIPYYSALPPEPPSSANRNGSRYSGISSSNRSSSSNPGSVYPYFSSSNMYSTRPGPPGGTYHMSSPPEPSSTTYIAPIGTVTVEDLTLLRPDDLDAIKLLKRELALAVQEENYTEAIRLRDHAWMRVYRDIHLCRVHGRYEDAHRLEVDLRRQIQVVSENY